MEKINNLVKRELINPTIDIAVDYSDIVLDSLLDNDLLSEIPIVKTLLAGTNIVLAVKEKFFVKKLLGFLAEFHTGTINEERYKDYKGRLENDEKFKDAVIEVLTLMIDRHIAVNQSKIMANLFKAHINGHYAWDRFNILCITLDKLHPGAYEILNKMSEMEKNLNRSYRGSMVGAQGEGSLSTEEEGMLLAGGIIAPRGTHYSVTPIGKDLYQYGIIKVITER